MKYLVWNHVSQRPEPLLWEANNRLSENGLLGMYTYRTGAESRQVTLDRNYSNQKIYSILDLRVNLVCSPIHTHKHGGWGKPSDSSTLPIIRYYIDTKIV